MRNESYLIIQDAVNPMNKKEEVSKVKRRLWESPNWKLSPSGTRI